MKNKPDVCSSLNFAQRKSERIDVDPENEDYITKYNKFHFEAYRKFKIDEKNLTGMNRRARLAEVILGLVIVFILNCACFAYCKLTNKKKNVQNMQMQVNE